VPTKQEELKLTHILTKLEIMS